MFIYDISPWIFYLFQHIYQIVETADILHDSFFAFLDLRVTSEKKVENLGNCSVA